MGMDVFGNNPTAPEGKYFRNNIWWWHPLATYVCKIAPDLTKGCQDWHSNDGDGLDAECSFALANKLQAEIDIGRTAKYEKVYIRWLESLPNETCSVCAGTGTCEPASDVLPGEHDRGRKECNCCAGSGFVRPFETQFPFSTENVQRFVRFLMTSGGFQIW